MAGIESKHEQIAEALREHLASIQSDNGATYWYTPGRVVRTIDLDPEWLDSSLEHIVFVVPGLETHLEAAVGQVDVEMEVFLMIARRHTPASENPLTVGGGPTRWLIVNRCARDVLKKLWAWNVSGSPLKGLGIVNIAKVEEGILIDRVKELKSWALQEFRFVVQYRYAVGAP